MPVQSRNRLSSVANAARVLKSFSSHHPTWGVGELAHHLSLSTSTTHRLLSTLADEGLLDQDATDGRYRLGLTVFDLAAAAPTQRTLHEASLVAMTELRSRTGETVQIGVLDGREVVYVERLDSPHTLRVFTELGRRNHVHCSSTGKVLLAFAPRHRRDALLAGWQPPALTDRTITDMTILRKELTKIRRTGYAENREEAEPGVVSVAAPIRDGSGEAVAAMSLAGPSDRMDLNRGEYPAVVTFLAKAISAQMGWTPPGDSGS